MTVTLGWFLNFIVALNNGWEILLARESPACYSGSYRFLTTFENKIFKISAFISSLSIVYSTSDSVVSSDDLTLSNSNSLTVLPSCLLAATYFSFKFA